jgi:hypothetical protein
MARKPHDVDQTHIFGWDEEPLGERPSEFVQSTGYSVLSGYHLPSELNARAARRRKGSGAGFTGLVIVFVVLLGASGFAMHKLIELLK